MTSLMDFNLNADVSNYVGGLSQASQSTSALENRIAALGATAAGMNAVLAKITPGRAALAGLASVATVAANNEQAMSSLAATSVTTGASFGKLSVGIRSLAREIPIGSQAARASVAQISQMGVAGAGTEKQVLSLSKTMQQLGAATGDNVNELTQGLVRLTRSTGSLDPKRVAAMADSLTVVSAKSGASASGILAFSKSISPLATAAGIGQTATMGIAAAFTRLGEDGVGAATAFNKMVSDMSHSVRDGSPDMAKYANIVGTTRKEFEALYKADPAKALTSVFNALASKGPAASRDLESLGLDGTRTLRSITAASREAGGLDKTIKDSMDGLGSGSTKKAADKAFSGLNDSFAKLRENAAQTGDALGRPLLAPIGVGVSALTTLAGGIRHIADNPIMNNVMAAAGWGGLGVMALKKITSPLSGYATAKWASKALPTRAAMAGYLEGRSGTTQLPAGTEGPQPAPLTGKRAGYVGEETLERGRAGNWLMASGREASTSKGIYGFTRKVGERVSEMQGPDGAGVKPGFWRTARATASMAGEAATRLSMESYAGAAQANSPWTQKLLTSGNSKAAEELTKNLKLASEKMKTDFVGGIRDTRNELKTWRAALSESQTPLQRTLSSARIAGSTAGRFAGSTIKDAAGLALKGGQALLGTVGGIGAGIGLATTAGVAINANMNRQRENLDALGQRNIYETLNTYRDALGLAGESGLSLADSFANTEKRLVKTATTPAEAAKITPEDTALATSTRSQVVLKRGGTDEQIAAQVRQMKVGQNLSGPELQAVQLDLLRQMPARAGGITGLLTGTPGVGTSSQISDIQKTIESMKTNTAEGGFGGGWRQFASAITGGLGPGSGGPTDFRRLSKTAGNASNVVFEGIEQGYKSNTASFGEAYGAQERYKMINAAVAAAQKGGDSQVIADTKAKAYKQLTGSSKPPEITQEEIDKAGSYVAAVTAHDREFAKTYASQYGSTKVPDKPPYPEGKTQPNPMAGGFALPADKRPKETDVPTQSGIPGFGTLTAMAQDSTFVKQMTDPKNGLGAYGQLWKPKPVVYSNAPQGSTQEVDPTRGGNNATSALEKYTVNPSNVGYQTSAVDAFIGDATKAGQSLGDLSAAAMKSADIHGQFDDAIGQLQMAILHRAQEINAIKISNMAPGAGLRATITANNKVLAYKGTITPEIHDEQLKARASNASALAALRDREAAFLTQQKQYNTSVARLNRNAALSVSRAETDYYTQRSQSNADFLLQRGYAIADANTAVKRATDTFNDQQAHSEDEFQRGRVRTRQDFARTLARQAEDAAKTLYEPYQRIQTQSVWDSNQLIANVGEQNAKLAEQHANLGKAKKAGLSQSAVDFLGLSKTENAQQLAHIIDDISNDPTVVARMNAAAKKRLALSKEAVTDPNNVDYRRQREDFDRALSQQQADFSRSVAYSRKLFNIQLGYTASDQAKSIARMDRAHDTQLARSDKQFALQIGRMATDTATALGDMEKDLADSRLVITGDAADLAKNVGDVIKKGTTDWTSFMVTGMADMTQAVIDGKDPMLAAYADLYGAAAAAAAAAGTGGGAATEPGSIPGTHDHPTAMASPLHQRARISQGYGVLNSRYASGHHTGIDYAVPVGTPVYAELGGTVLSAKMAGKWGNSVVIDHGGGHTTRYAHLSAFGVRAGQIIGTDARIGASGNTGNSTGPHLHFEADVDGKDVNPVAVAAWGRTNAAAATTMPALPAAPSGPGSGNPYGLQGTRWIGYQAMQRHGWNQWTDLNDLVMGESGWRATAQNPTSTAYGLFQFLNSTWKGYGPKTSDPVKQSEYGMEYIKNRYGDPHSAEVWKRAHNWYAEGSVFTGRRTIGVGEAGPEAVLPLNERGVVYLARVMERYLTGDEVRGARTSGHAAVVHYHQDTITNDHSTLISGNQIKVVSDDPDKMADQLASRSRRDNLVKSNLRR